VLTEYVPAALIDEVLADTGRLERRVRRLAARVTVLFILALTLFSGQGYRGVWRELAHNGGADAGVTPSSSALAQARRRIGLAPLAALFARLRGVQAVPGMAGAFLAGLRLVSWDATMLDVADSRGEPAAFITSRNRRGVGAFAKVRLRSAQGPPTAITRQGRHQSTKKFLSGCGSAPRGRTMLPRATPRTLTDVASHDAVIRESAGICGSRTNGASTTSDSWGRRLTGEKVSVVEQPLRMPTSLRVAEVSIP
jgi:hypothetical protein